MSNDLAELLESHDDTQICKSCGVEYKDHLGLIGTCNELWSQVSKNDRMKASVSRANMLITNQIELATEDRDWNQVYQAVTILRRLIK